MPKFDMIKTYRDGTVPTETDFDNIKNSYEEFVNVTGLGADNIQDGAFTAPLIAPDTIFTSKLATNSVTDAKLQSSASSDSMRAVTTTSIKNGSVTQQKLSALFPGGSVLGYSVYSASDNRLQIKNASVSLSTLQTRGTAAQSVGQGGFAISPGCGAFFTNGNLSDFGGVPNLSVTLVTTGRPVLITLVPDIQASSAPYGQGYILGTTLNTSTGMTIRLLRDGTIVQSTIKFRGGPAGGFRWVDNPPTNGLHTYQLLSNADTANFDQMQFIHLRLVAFEI